MRAWTDKNPNVPTLRASLIFALAVAVVCLAIIWFGGSRAGASPRWYCSTTTTQGQPCIPDETTDPTTTIPVVTTAPSVTNPCPGSGCPQPSGVVSTTVSTIATSTTATTVAPPASLIPPLVVTAAPTTTVPQELPVTGGDSAWLFVLGGSLVALGLLFLAWTRPA